MVEKTFNIEFDGYWREQNIGGVPEESGVYCVYECTYNSSEKTVTIRRLIYIGEADNVRNRITNHEKKNDWMRYVRSGNVLCFSFAPVLTADRSRVEAALIFKHKPPVNEEYKNSFPFDRTTISISGKTAELITQFTLERTE